MLEDIELSQAEAKFTELLGKIAGSNYEYKADNEDRVVAFTASCGLAEFTVDESVEDLLRRADEALYVAKRTGKNRVVLAKKTKSLWQTLRPFRRGVTDRQ
jgi:PleD family two-component response regulator